LRHSFLFSPELLFLASPILQLETGNYSKFQIQSFFHPKDERLNQNAWFVFFSIGRAKKM
jgi:hypothetical protein